MNRIPTATRLSRAMEGKDNRQGKLLKEAFEVLCGYIDELQAQIDALTDAAKGDGGGV